MLKFKKGKGSLSIPIGEKVDKDNGFGKSRRDIKPKPTSFAEWSKNLKSK